MSIEDFLEDDTEYAEIPGLKDGQVVRIKSLTAGDIIEWSEASEGEAKRTAGLRLIIRSVVDAEGKLLMDDTYISTLRKKSHKITERIVREILRHNGMQVKQQEDVKKD